MRISDWSSDVCSSDLIRAVVHTPDSGPDQPAGLSADDLITLTATVTDGDGDTASATANIGQNLVFKDDAPVANDDSAGLPERSEERRGGKEGVSTCRTRW